MPRNPIGEKGDVAANLTFHTHFLSAGFFESAVLILSTAQGVLGSEAWKGVNVVAIRKVGREEG